MGLRKIKTRRTAAVVVINEDINEYEQNGGKESECEKVGECIHGRMSCLNI